MSAFSDNVLIFTVFVIKIRFLSKLATKFGFFMKLMKKMNTSLDFNYVKPYSVM